MNQASCIKNFSQFPGATGGVFIPRCALHEFCLGFSTQPQQETMDDAFSYFITREKMPKTIICDYACLFLSYCLYREPERFEDTLIVCDEFHWDSHLCSKAFNSNIYRAFNDVLEFCNTSAPEQHNSIIANMKNSTRYMRKALFTRVVTISLEIINRRLATKYSSLPKNNSLNLE